MLAFIYREYVTRIDQVQVGLHDNDRYVGEQTNSLVGLHLPNMMDPAWNWYNSMAVTSDCNKQQVYFR